MVDFHMINDDVINVDYRKMDGFEAESHITKEVMAALTTCYEWAEWQSQWLQNITVTPRMATNKMATTITATSHIPKW